jgi:hypothetical protein
MGGKPGRFFLPIIFLITNIFALMNPNTRKFLERLIFFLEKSIV